MTVAAVERSPANAAQKNSNGAGAIQWSVRRELWENRSVYVGPLAAAGIFLLGFFASLVARPAIVQQMRTAASGTSVTEPYMYGALVIMATGVVVGIFYCLDALYAERRDRSILFWKSLPVSDTVTVMSKAAVAFVVLPLITIAITVVLHLVMLVSSSIILIISGSSPSELWRAVAPVDLAVRLIYHILSIHVLWYAPILAWLLLASAWARRAPFVWAGIPILAVVVIERLVMGTSGFLNMLRFRVMGGPESFAGTGDMLGHVNPVVFVQSPGLWIGLAVTAVFLAAAVRIRRANGPA